MTFRCHQPHPAEPNPIYPLGAAGPPPGWAELPRSHLPGSCLPAAPDPAWGQTLQLGEISVPTGQDPLPGSSPGLCAALTPQTRRVFALKVCGGDPTRVNRVGLCQKNTRGGGEGEGKGRHESLGTVRPKNPRCRARLGHPKTPPCREGRELLPSSPSYLPTELFWCSPVPAGRFRALQVPAPKEKQRGGDPGGEVGTLAKNHSGHERSVRLSVCPSVCPGWHLGPPRSTGSFKPGCPTGEPELEGTPPGALLLPPLSTTEN